jgi:26S proteasome non-ATPase regulatory subunit 10
VGWIRLYLVNSHVLNDQDGRTPLHWAATTSNLGMTQLLLSYSPDIEARDAVGWTPLMVAGESQLLASLRDISQSLLGAH